MIPSLIQNIILFMVPKLGPQPPPRPPRRADRDTDPPSDDELFKGDPKICEERGHWHSYKATWFSRGVEMGPTIGHSSKCLRCGWSDPCVWT